MSKEHPLRGVFTCTGCKRKYSSRITTKYINKGTERFKKEYPYYGCGKT